jgi:hypothetical protein
MFNRIAGFVNRLSPKISRGIGQVSNIARNVGQGIQHVRNIGSIANQMSNGRIGNSQFGQKMAEITNKINNVADNVVNNEQNAHNFVSTIGRKVNA